MFRIPLRIGRNNEIEELSDIGSITDRGTTQRSHIINTEQQIFEEEMGGEGFDIFARKEDIVDLNVKDIPVELFGSTNV